MKIKHIRIENFKNMVEFDHDFNEQNEIIASEFGSGKSTIMDAYKWVFGLDVPNYEPTIDRRLVKGITTRVVLTFEKDNLEFELERGSHRTVSGSVVSSFSYCGNPAKSLKAYRAKIESLFNIPFSTIEILLDIKKFNSTDTKWTWKEQREFLFNTLNIDDSIKKILKNDKYSWIAEQFIRDRSLTEIDILKKLNADKSLFDKQISNNYAIIENNKTKIAEYGEVDFAKLKAEKAEIEKKIDSLQNSSNKERKAEKIIELSKELDKLYTKLSSATKEISKQKGALVTEKAEITRKINHCALINSTNISKAKEIDALIENHHKTIEEVQADTFDEAETVCKYCGAPLKAEDVQEKRDLFEKNKQSKIAKANEEIENLKKEKKSILETMKMNKSEYISLKEYEKELDSKVVSEEEVEKVNSEIESLKNEIASLKVSSVNAEVEKELENLKSRLDVLNGEIYHESLITALLNENKDFTAQNKDIALKEQKRLQYEVQVNDFINDKIKVVSDLIEKKFKNIKFQFFKYNRTDGEQKNICAVLYKESDYSQCSVGQKIALNFYLNESLQDIFETDFPVWVDDIGSAKIFESKHQMIGLLTDNSKKLPYIQIRQKYTLEDCENN